jgi:hypothetical protein
MDRFQAEEKFDELARYYDGLAQKAKKTGGKTEFLNAYFSAREYFWRAIMGTLISWYPPRSSPEELVGQFNERAMRIFQA